MAGIGMIPSYEADAERQRLEAAADMAPMPIAPPPLPTEDEAREQARRTFEQANAEQNRSQALAAAGGDPRKAAQLLFQQTALPNETARTKAAELPSFKAAPPPPSGATVTSHMGGVQVQQQLAPGGDITQRSGGGSKGESYAAPTKVEGEIVADKAYVEDQRLRTQGLETEQAVKKAQVDSDIAARKAADIAAANLRQQKDVDEAEAEVKRVKAIEHADEMAWRQEAKGQPKGFFADRSAPQQIAGGMALLLGFFGGASDGSNVGADSLLAATERDTAAWKQRLQNRLDILNNSKANVTSAKAETKRQIELAGVRKIALLENLATEAESKMKAMGMDDAAIQGHVGLLKIRDEVLDERMKREEGLRKKITAEQHWNRVSTTGGAGGPGAASANSEALEAAQIAEANERFASMARTKPQAWARLQKAMNSSKSVASWEKAWGIGDAVSAAKGWGLIANDVQERLKGDPEALDLFSALSPVVTAKARQADPKGAINQDATDTAEQRLALRAQSAEGIAQQADLMAREQRNKVAVLTRGRGLAGPAQAPAASGGDIVMVRDRKTGQQIRARRHPDGRLEALE